MSQRFEIPDVPPEALKRRKSKDIMEEFGPETEASTKCSPEALKKWKSKELIYVLFGPETETSPKVKLCESEDFHNKSFSSSKTEVKQNRLHGNRLNQD
ncbi:hypothetical protein WMY93_032665 [Mugilogobius chulae]|uniref:Uncharacterized protein n=1 Tax=Mugilogobius chulae TaxID=88201 RepID=A0AAW0MMY8_9GOBI